MKKTDLFYIMTYEPVKQDTRFKIVEGKQGYDLVTLPSGAIAFYDRDKKEFIGLETK